MPRQGGQGKGKPKLKDRDFGKALIKQSLNQAKTKLAGRNERMESILDNSALEDYVLTTEMDGREAEVKHVHQFDAFLVEPTVSPSLQALSSKNFDYEHLRIPRKPGWNEKMTADDIDRQEKDAFLEWRREIAAMELANGVRKVTPFEKNLQVWRQLWRVIERSDFAVQIVDARNPLLFYTEDLLKYALEQRPPKPLMLLVNKADFLTEYQRRCWADHFDKLGLKFVFYSAQIEKEKLEAEEEASGDWREEVDPLVEDLVAQWETTKAGGGGVGVGGAEPGMRGKGDDVAIAVGDGKRNGKGEGISEGASADADVGARSEDGDVAGGHMQSVSDNVPERDDDDGEPTPDAANGGASKGVSWNGLTVGKKPTPPWRDRGLKTLVLTRLQLIHLLTSLPAKLQLRAQGRHGGRFCVGMLGYPNVGKSSVINTILGVSKSTHGQVRVAVSSTPGKTKHFQTLLVSDKLMLCDCPGLVFPSFMSSAGEMLCSGILPINQMRDAADPASVIASRVPMHLLDAAYGMTIQRHIDVKDNPDRPPTATEMLHAYCALKGYITNGMGRWDEFRACKDLLRDLNDGRLLFVAQPPRVIDEQEDDEEVSKQKISKWLSETEKTMIRRERVAERVAMLKLKELQLEEKTLSSSSSSPFVGAGESEMVFGFDRKQSGAPSISTAQSTPTAEGEFEIVDDSDEDDAIGESVGEVKTGTREHKRLKHWGKKNKKLRDKNPYSEENGVISYVAFTTNRIPAVVSKEDPGKARRRHDIRQNYGSEFIRTTLPHHVADGPV